MTAGGSVLAACVAAMTVPGAGGGGPGTGEGSRDSSDEDASG